MKSETIILNAERNVSLTVYLHDDDKVRPGILVIPGGAYQMCADGEADPAALSYLNADCHAFILRYTVGESMVWPEPLNDYDEAITLIREKAEEWHVYADKIAVVGFSSGGHLAAAAATMSENRPNAAILGYAVLSDIVKLRNKTAPSTVEAVDDKTPPCFLFQSRTDPRVPVMTSIKFMEALAEHDISFESHTYAYGPHGCSTCANAPLASDDVYCSRMKHWVTDSIAWLHDVFGDYTEDGMTAPRIH